MSVLVRLCDIRVPALVMTFLVATACTRSPPANDDEGAPKQKGTTATVSVITPKQQTFHSNVTGFGTLSGDSHSKQILSLPQAGQVVVLNVAAGRRVKRGDVLLQLATDPTTRFGYQQAESALQLARGELARTERLASEHLATNTQLATARKALTDAESVLQQQSRLGGGSDHGILSAPADGVVTTVSVHIGERLQPGVPLAEFTASGAVVAQLGVEPSQATNVRVGMNATITPVYGAMQILPGTVTMVANAVDPQTHLLNVLIALNEGSSADLVSGAALTGTVDTADFTAWAVPRDAVLSDDGGSYLYQVHDAKAHRVPVKVLAPEGETLGVSGALEPGDQVITLGAYELSDGDSVRGQPVVETKE